MCLFQKWSWPEPCVSNVGSEDQNGNILKPRFGSSSLLVVYILHRQWVLLNHRELHNKVAKPQSSGQQNAPGRLSVVWQPRNNSNRGHIWLLFISAGRTFITYLSTIISFNISFNIGEHVEYNQGLEKALRCQFGHSLTTTTPRCFPMSVVVMIKSLTFSVFIIQFQRGGCQIDRRTAYRHILFACD